MSNTYTGGSNSARAGLNGALCKQNEVQTNISMLKTNTTNKYKI